MHLAGDSLSCLMQPLTDVPMQRNDVERILVPIQSVNLLILEDILEDPDVKWANRINKSGKLHHFTGGNVPALTDSKCAVS